MSNTQQLFKGGKARGEGEAQAEQWMESARGTADSVSNRAADTAQSARERKEHAAGFLQQTGDQVMQMAHGAAESVKNAIGVDNNSSTTAASTTTTTTTRH